LIFDISLYGSSFTDYFGAYRQKTVRDSFRNYMKKEPVFTIDLMQWFEYLSILPVAGLIRNKHLCLVWCPGRNIRIAPLFLPWMS
jgi:hypothetical protein